MLPIVLAALLSGAPGYTKTVRYDLEAHLHPEQKRVEGAGRVLWTNHGSRPVRELWWHLYLNAFRNDRSTFMVESNGGKLRGDEFDRESWGWIEVTTLTAKLGDASGDILAKATFEHPDDDNEDDRTVLRTPLPFAVGPGQTVEVELAFTSKLPKVFARSGWAGSFFMVAQWFPKIGVLQETFTGTVAAEGEEPAWNCHQYHAHSEYFADYGEFHVAIDVPEDYVVGASGVRVGTEAPTPGRVTYVHHAEKVHDFAWTADPRFIEIERRFVATEQVEDFELENVAGMLDEPIGEVVLSDVDVKLLIQPEHEQYADRYFAATFAAIKWFGLWYGPYPYRVLTVVDGPRGAGGAMGMEYPTLITGGVRWPADPQGPRPEMVTIHEFGHQFWYGLVGSNEFEESWLDEGFNTYSTGKVADKVYGSFRVAPRAFGGVPLTWWFPNVRLYQKQIARLGTMAGPDDDAIVRNSWSYRSSSSYGINSYPRSANTLLQLENVVGEATLVRALRTYQKRWRYGHPRTEDFIAVVEEVHGAPLDDYFRKTIHTPGRVDFEVESLKSKKRKTPAGVFDDVTKMVTKKEAKAADENKKAVYDTTVYLRRNGPVDFPVLLEVTFEDTTTATRTWDGVYRWQRFDFETKSKAKQAVIHPYGGQRLDTNRSNDSRRLEKNHIAGVAWGSHVLYFAQTFWQLLAGLL